MGLRLRLKASYSTAGFSGQALVILPALKRYGLIVADNGSPWYITGAPSPSWDEASLNTLKQVPGLGLRSGRNRPDHPLTRAGTRRSAPRVREAGAYAWCVGSAGAC